jgi:hypothetical protein
MASYLLGVVKVGALADLLRMIMKDGALHMAPEKGQS